MPGQKIKILHLIKSLGRGGAETLLVQTAKFHDLEKFELHVIYFLPWKNQLVAELQQAGVHVLNIPARNNLRIIRSFKLVEKYIQTHQINLLHCHLPWAGFLGRLIHFRTQIPTLYTEHNKQERYHFLTRLLNKITFNHQTKVVAVSEDVRNSILKNIPVEIPVVTISNGIDTVHYHKNLKNGNIIRVSLGISPDALVLGTLAVFRKQKCLLKWLDVFAALYDGNPNLRGIMVGDGPLMNEILAYRKKLGLEEVVFLPGMKSNAADWYNAMDIFMISSEFEGLPLALLEAMATEKPVVSTNAGGIGEVLQHTETGYLVNFGDWSGLMNAAQSLIDDKSLCASMGMAGRLRIMDAYSLKQMVSSLEIIYNKYGVQKIE
jgi:glycosyltransferase involved in cell wall biosynthesis